MAGGVILGALLTLGVLGVAGLVVITAGAYDIAASDKHLPVVRWAFDTTMRNAVERQAADLVPPEPPGPEAVEAGAAVYAGTCAHCHGGPGVERASWADGMRPQPPELVEAAAEWSRAEVFWIARHGLKMTGMPSFAAVHDDTTLWNVAAFVGRLPGMTPEDYRGLAGEAAHGHGGSGDTQDGGETAP